MQLISVLETADALYIWNYYTADKATAFGYLLYLWNLFVNVNPSWEFASTFSGKADNFF